MTNNISQFSSVSWSTGEAVTVNTRALIDKVLARYSAENTVFRELFQNAADAGARHVVLKWESGEEMLPDVDLERRGILDVLEGKEGVEGGNLALDSRSGKTDGRGSVRGVSAKVAVPAQPYFEKAEVKYPRVSDRDGNKGGKKKRFGLSRLRTTMSKNTLSPAVSFSAPSAPKTVELVHCFPTTRPTTGQHNTNNPPPDTLSYTHSSEVLRNLLWCPTTQVGEHPRRKLYRRLIVQNDGKAFGVADWARLKRIAEGNPDETKIGAFGVGFYSVFSECDEPVVFSGGKAMAFYWDGDRENGGGNQLMTRTAEAGDGADDGWTVFNLPYRKPTPLPGVPELARFLATSLVFVRLESIKVFVDGVKLFTVERKDFGLSAAVALPAGLAVERNPKLKPGNTDDAGIKMSVTGVSMRQIEMRAIYTDGIFGAAKEENLKGKGAGVCIENVSLEISTATIVTDVDESIAAELKRAILKPPPKETTLSMVCAAIPTTDSPTENSSLQVFSHILPCTTPQGDLPLGIQNDPGRVFIGFQTHQTTGFQCHLSTHSVIPTVERENIDFNARYVRDWNLEILRMAGILARCMYDYDIQRLHKFIVEAPQSRLAANQIAKRIMQKFAFRPTTPSTHVGEVVKHAFFNLDQRKEQTILRGDICLNVDIMSSKGVRSVKDVLLPVSASFIHKADREASDCDWLLEEFMQNVPLMIKEFVYASPVFVANLSEHGTLRTVDFGDVIRDLRSRVLSQTQARSLLSWMTKRYENCSSGSPRITLEQIKQVLSEVSVKLTATGSPIKLSGIKYFLGNTGPLANVEMASLPPTCITQELLTPELQQNRSMPLIFGWTELKTDQWLNHIVLNSDLLSKDRAFAINVLRVLNSGWSSYSISTKSEVKRLLDIRQCIPTVGHGICVPARVHFPGVNWVGTLPVLALELAEKEVGGISEDFLHFIGVRKTVELKSVLERLMSEVTNRAPNRRSVDGHPTCNQAELVNYLLTLQEKIPPGDMNAIKNIEFCSAERGKKLYKPCELYEPRAELRQLGLPVMFWPTPWEEMSFAGRKILEDLGLKRAPDIVALAKIAATAGYQNSAKILRERALNYMLSNWASNGYSANSIELRNIRFLPVENPAHSHLKGVRSPPATLVAVTECYWHPRAGVLGFHVLRSDLKDHAPKLQIPEHPPIEELVRALLHNPPRDDDDARVVFMYMAQFIPQLTPMLIDQLRMREIVPVRVRSNTNTDRSSTTNPMPSSAQKKHKIPSLGSLSPSEAAQQYQMRRPCEVFTNLSLVGVRLVARLFEFADFGVVAGQFLQKLGAKTSPSDHDVAVMLVENPWKVFQVLGLHEYVNRLKQLAVSRTEIWLPGSELEQKMRTSQFLVGEVTAKRSLVGDGNESEEEDGTIHSNTKTVVKLVSASEVLVSDDYTSYKLFREAIVVCPFDDILEEMYQALGALKLSNCVEMKYQTGATLKNSALAESLRKLIVERTPLFFYENQFRGSRTPVKKWLSGIDVKIVSHIMLERRIHAKHTLQGVSVEDVQISTAAIPESMVTDKSRTNGSFDGNTVLVRLGWNSYDLAFALVGRLCKSPSPGAIYLFDCLLKEDLKVLESRGYNVHRILKAKEEEEKLITIKEPVEIKHVMVPPLKQPGFEATASTGTIETYNWRPKDQDVQRALAGAKPFSGTFLSSTAQTTTAGLYTYCDQLPGHELVFHTRLTNGIPVFMEKGKPSIFPKYEADFESFSRLLGDIGTAIGLPVASIHLCYEPKGKTIAFNSNGSLFFNLHFWHIHGHNQQTDAARTDGITWWFMVMCHELAHNMVKAHNTEHSSHIENIAAKHFPSIARLLPNVVVDNKGQMIFPQVDPVVNPASSRKFRTLRVLWRLDVAAKDQNRPL
ncbi:hypothetical protein L211DRAFT_848883 [Terfezia boudieri ATCC MYA-4762]|uniref:Uncharacterized protein n=1 Tax=Terfezia boudieri ATCC MYA-4762 TaxID=1051890 RepID=A0A3N4LNT8_9PEZI|nr:hypothetical protein L211DRAFT_848883 [Terfezia boudieri ATCC MYA-4762]